MSHSSGPSHVLMAIGRTKEQAGNSLRMSISKYTTEKEIKQVLYVLPKIVKRIKSADKMFGRK